MTDLKIKKVVHEPVLVSEVVELLDPVEFAHLNIADRKVIIDATVGAGGHSKEFIKRGYFVLGIDDDERMLEKAEQVLIEACPSPLLSSEKGGCFKLVHGNFRNIDSIVKETGVSEVVAVLYDLGISIFHYKNDSRGFSFQENLQPLDMRLNSSQGVTASDLVNSLPKKELISLFSTVMEYKDALRLTGAIVEARKTKKINSVGDFVEIVESSLRNMGKINVATKPMMALRIAVNSELENIAESLPKAFSLMVNGGRLAVISFHSGEDRIVKKFFKGLAQNGKCKLLTKKPIEPGEVEIGKNPLSRSAKLRVIEKL